MYKSLIKPLFFAFDPEKVHHFVFSTIKWTSKIPGISFCLRKTYAKRDKRWEKDILGLKFSNPIGLAAGFDKNAELYNELADFGFGFIEIGTVTPKAQKGNPKKRLFRLPQDESLINRMGFNNNGLEAAVERLKKNKGKVILGGNLGKNTSSMPDHYIDDYKVLAEGLHPYVDYFVLNVSCPNVGPMAKLQDKDFLVDLISEVEKINASKDKRHPLFLKIAPDLNDGQLDEVLELLDETAVDGIIASNTSTSREGLNTSEERLKEIGNGGLSGASIKDKSTRIISYLRSGRKEWFPIIGVGGIQTAEDAIEKLDAGADLLQVYTGFIYEGPGIVKNILSKL